MSGKQGGDAQGRVKFLVELTAPSVPRRTLCADAPCYRLAGSLSSFSR